MENNDLLSFNENINEMDDKKREKKKLNKFNFFIGTVLVLLLFTSVLIYFNHSTTEKIQVWEYKVIEFYTEENNYRIGSGSLNFNTINVNETELNRLGQDGWELVSSHLEMETAFPNFGNDSYVNGIQPNIRPQKLVIIFKRPNVY